MVVLVDVVVVVGTVVVDVVVDVVVVVHGPTNVAVPPVIVGVGLPQIIPSVSSGCV